MNALIGCSATHVDGMNKRFGLFGALLRNFSPRTFRGRSLWFGNVAVETSFLEWCTVEHDVPRYVIHRSTMLLWGIHCHRERFVYWYECLSRNSLKQDGWIPPLVAFKYYCCDITAGSTGSSHRSQTFFSLTWTYESRGTCDT